jgi:Fe-S cluster biosynthesis and repair protein YggX
MARNVQCIKLGKEAEGLDFPPYPGELGKRIWEGVSKQAWADWLKHQTMLVNENRLNLADLRARQYLARQMENHFFGDGADAAQGYVPLLQLRVGRLVFSVQRDAKARRATRLTSPPASLLNP